MRWLILILALFALGSLATPPLAASYSVTVQTDHSSYVGMAQIVISGTVSPAPGPNTAVIVVVSNPNNATVDIQDDPVNPATGSFSQVTVAGGSISCGGSPCWFAGVYLVNATWGGPGGSVKATTTFTYLPFAPATTSVSCAPASFAVGATSQCTATVSGGHGPSRDGETVTFSQTGGSGGVSFLSPATCALSGNGCSITVTGGSPGQVTIQASYPGDFVNPASNGTANVTVTQATTTTSVSCTYPGANLYSCTASVSGAAGTISGETVTFSQTGGSGSVTLPSPATCTLSGTSCLIAVTGSSSGPVTIQASYGGDTNNAGSSGTATIAVNVTTTVAPPVATVTTTPQSTSTVTVTASSSSSGSTTTTTSTSSMSTSSSGGLGPLAYLIVAVVAVIVIALGVVMWRRRVAGEYGKPPAAAP